MAGQDTERDPVEELADEFASRMRAGETPDVEEYARRCPERASEVRELLPTVYMVERSKARRARSADGRVSLGGPRPDQLGDFRIVREIGRGGMGVVYEAVQESLERPVAVKVLPHGAGPQDRDRFRQEAQTAARLHHTNIVPVYADGDHNGYCFFAMQLVTGVSLDQVIRHLKRDADQPTESGQPEQRRLLGAIARSLVTPRVDRGVRTFTPDDAYWQRIARIGIHVADALHCAHDSGVLHRDIKPGNLLLDDRGKVWVSDFGLANVRTGTSPQCPDQCPEAMSGTLAYMAPESLTGAADPQSDVYGLGLTLYELVTLQKAFPQAEQGELVRAITTGEIPRPRRVCRSLPRDLDAIIRRATSVEPRLRYASAAAFAADLRRFVDGRAVAARPVGPVRRAARCAKRNPAIASLSGAVLLLLLTVARVLTIGYVNTRRALAAETQERDRAEETTVVALDALDKTFARLAPRRMGTALGEFGDRLTDGLSRPVLAAETATFLEDLLASYDRLAVQSDGKPTIRRATAGANIRVGDINRRLGRFDAALAGYRRALTIYASLAHDPSASDRGEIAMARNEIGLILLLLNRDPSAGRQLFRDAIDTLNAGSHSTSVPPQERFELARSYYFLGLRPRPATRPDGQPPTPRRRPTPDDPILTAIAVTTELKDRFPDVPAYRHLLACCYLELGRGPLSQEGQTAIALLETLCDDFHGEPDFLLDLSEAYSDFEVERLTAPGDLMGDIDGYFRKALRTAERLDAGHPNIPNYTFSQGQIRAKFSLFLRAGHLDAGRLDAGRLDAGKRSEAEEQLAQSVSIQAKLVREFPAVVRYRVWLASYQGSLAQLHADVGRWPEAVRLLDTATASLEQVLAQDPNQRFGRASLTQTYDRLVTVCNQAGLSDRAADAKKRSEKLRNTQAPQPARGN